MRSVLFAIVFLVATSGCSSPTVAPKHEDFLVTLEKMQQDQKFLESRTVAEFSAVQWFEEDGDIEATSRKIPCGISEMHRSGWDVLPTAKELSLTDASYIVDTQTIDSEATVVLGVPEGVADARYFFSQHQGKWYLVHMDIYSAALSGGPTPSLPCMRKA